MGRKSTIRDDDTDCHKYPISLFDNLIMQHQNLETTVLALYFVGCPANLELRQQAAEQMRYVSLFDISEWEKIASDSPLDSHL